MTNGPKTAGLPASDGADSSNAQDTQVSSDVPPRRSTGSATAPFVPRPLGANTYPSPPSPARTPRALRGHHRLVVGRLIEHGPTREGGFPSYYVKLLTIAGPRTLRGKDLYRAVRFAETKPQIGDRVGVRKQPRQAVTLMDQVRNPEGRVVAQTEHLAHRAQWQVEKLQFFVDRARKARLVRDAHLDVQKAVRKQPELKSTFLSFRALDEVLQRRGIDSQDREEITSMIREAVASSIQNGEPLPDIRLRDRGAKAKDKTPPARDRSREEPTR